MEKEKRKALALGILIGFVIVAAIFIFLWGTYLNRGTIRIIAEPPYQVITLEGEILCDISPCEIVQKRGIKDLILAKAGYQSVSTEVTVKLWSTVDLEINFIRNPYIEKTTAFPEPEKTIDYEIIFSEEKKSYKLVVAGEQQRPIVYFLKEIKDPQIFGSENGALIVDDEIGYKIDIQNAERKRINEDFSNIEGGVWSVDGQKFAYTISDSDNIWVINQNNSVNETSLNKVSTSYAWSYDGDLFYISKVNDSYNFGEYNPETDTYITSFSSSELPALPDDVIPTNNGRRIYFQIGEEKYVLVLE